MTGGGGAQAQSTGACSANDQYAIGWSYTNSRGTACGAAPRAHLAGAGVPLPQGHGLGLDGDGDARPTRLGRTFDVQTYTFDAAAGHLHRQRAAGGHLEHGPRPSRSTRARRPATFTCTLDGGAPTACTSPITYTGLTEGAHTFSVYATVGGVRGPAPRHLDRGPSTPTPPTTPTGFTAVGDVAVLGAR